MQRSWNGRYVLAPLPGKAIINNFASFVTKFDEEKWCSLQ